jgi:hypothetical protein
MASFVVGGLQNLARFEVVVAGMAQAVADLEMRHHAAQEHIALPVAFGLDDGTSARSDSVAGLMFDGGLF